MSWPGGKNNLELYKLAYDDGTTIKRWTSDPLDFTFSLDGQKYTAIPITRNEPAKTTQLVQSSMQITLPDNGHIDWENMIKERILDRAEFTLYQVDRDNDANYRIAYQGIVGDLDPVNLEEVNITIEDAFAQLDITVPRFKLRPGCNHIFCDDKCGLSLAAKTVSCSTVAGTTTTELRAAALQGYDDNYFRGGYIRITSGALSGIYRWIKSSEGTIGTVTVFPALGSVPSSANFSCIPHCGNTKAGCKAHSNLDNYLGFTDMPSPEEVYLK